MWYYGGYEGEQWGIPRMRVVPKLYSNWSMELDWYTCISHFDMYPTIEIIYNDFSTWIGGPKPTPAHSPGLESCAATAATA